MIIFLVYITILNIPGLNLSFIDTGKNVVVSKIPDQVHSANSIVLVILNGPKSLEVTSELHNRISKSHTDRILTAGNRISIMFYGKILKFEVKSLETNDKEINIENNFSRLNIEDRHEFYRTSESTKWTLYRYVYYFN